MTAIKTSLKSIDADLNHYRNQIVGVDKQVPLLDGSFKRYVHLDNAASTPSLVPVLKKVNQFLEWYSSIHRGSGFKSLLSSWVYDSAHQIVAEFVGADLESNTVIFTKNASEALNKLANRFPFSAGSTGKDEPVVLSSVMEHHSNDLPWRRKAKVIHAEVDEKGALDLDDIETKLRNSNGGIQLVAITAASNVTGYVNPIHRIASLAHEYGAKIVVDAAQLVAHRLLEVKPDHDTEHIDFSVFSAHKMYAPFGTGVLIGPKSVFGQGDPEHVGGGTVELVTKDDVEWTGLPNKEEVGSPNVIGAVALVQAIKTLQEMGMDNITQHENELTQYTIKKLNSIKDLVIYGSDLYDDNRLGVIAFNFKGVHHALVSTILSYEAGIGVRHGCFCAHPYIKNLLGITEEQSKKLKEEIRRSYKANLPGAVRISFGFYNTQEDVDRLIEALEKISKKEYKGTYKLNPRLGEFIPEDFHFNYRQYFDFS
jgi:cysteine desulfurase/selenocysteine lyase